MWRAGWAIDDGTISAEEDSQNRRGEQAPGETGGNRGKPGSGGDGAVESRRLKGHTRASCAIVHGWERSHEPGGSQGESR